MASRPVTRAFAAALDVAERETAFEMAASNLRFGPGVTRELGMDLREMGLTRVLVVTDRRLRDLPPVLTVLESLRSQHIDFDLFDQVAVEPTDQSFKEAIAAAMSRAYGGFVAVGGGSTIDTAKAANLYATHPPSPAIPSPRRDA